jgi:hypothetical protein
MALPPDEFLKYIKELDFFDLEDVGVFCKAYWDDYIKNPDDYDARYRYNACITLFGHLFLNFTNEAIKIRKEYDNRKALER